MKGHNCPFVGKSEAESFVLDDRTEELLGSEEVNALADDFTDSFDYIINEAERADRRKCLSLALTL